MRRLLALASLLTALAAPAWAAQPQIIETTTLSATVSDTGLTLTVTAGNAILFGIWHSSSTTRTYTVSCTTDGTPTADGSFTNGAGGRGVYLFHIAASAGGSITCTADQSSTFQSYDVVMAEVSYSGGTFGLSSAGSDGFMNTLTFNHFMAPSGELDLPADSLWVGMCHSASSLGTRTPTSGFETDLGSGGTALSVGNFWQWEDGTNSSNAHAAGFTDERGLWTSTGTMRDTYCRAWGFAITAASGYRTGGMLKGIG